MSTPEVFDAAQYLVEPKDLWTSQLPKKYLEMAPRVVTLDDGFDAWEFDGGDWVDPLGLEVAAGRPQGAALATRYRYDDLRPGVSDAKGRLADMDVDGIGRASIFPTFGLNLLNMRDDEAHRLCVRAYNDGVTAWCGEGDSARLVPHALIPVTGIDDAVAELDRVVGLGFRGVVFGGWPAAGRTPDPADDPFWRRCEEAGVVVHLLRGGPPNPERSTRARTPAAVARYMGGGGERSGATGASMETMVTDLVTTKNANMSWMVLTGVFERFPGLKVMLVQGGAGWLATCAELIDWNYRYAQFVPGNGFAHLKDLPSESIRRQVYATVESDQRGLDFLDERDRTGKVLWASAHPTSMSSWPGCRLAIEQQLHGVAADTRAKLLQDNFTDLYG